MFIGRKTELDDLNRRYKGDGFEFAIIYGRRRIGKTTMISEFIEGKKSVYYMSTEENAASQLQECSRAVLGAFGNASATFSSWEGLFDYVTDIAEKQRFIFAIDEYPYLAGKYHEISSILQKYIDGKWKNTKLFLILCGSSMSFMEKQVLGYESPLYGRRTCQYKLMPLYYYEGLQFFSGWTDEEKLLAYGICGGVPQYLSFFSKYNCLRDAVIYEFMSSGGHLREEPQNLLKQELRDPSAYYDILSAIASGANRQNEIADKTGKSRNMLSGYLANLVSLGIIEKIHPAGESSSKKIRYTLCDNLYRFYFRFIPSSLSLIELGMGERVYDTVIFPLMADYFGHIFEEVCLQYIEALMKKGEIAELYTDFGKWWGNDPFRKEQTDIDVVCMNSSDILVGECKWKTDAVTMDIFEELRHRASIISDGRKTHYALFSKSGFTNTVKEKAEDCLLVDLKEIAGLYET